MTFEVLLALFIMAVGFSVAGLTTHVYQGLWKQEAILRFDGATVFGMFGHLVMSFVCGPYIMLNMGWRQQDDGTISMTNVLLGAFIAFGWSFLSGLLYLGTYLALTT